MQSQPTLDVQRLRLWGAIFATTAVVLVNALLTRF